LSLTVKYSSGKNQVFQSTFTSIKPFFSNQPLISTSLNTISFPIIVTSVHFLSLEIILSFLPSVNLSLNLSLHVDHLS
jgi:hypothetical protein